MKPLLTPYPYQLEGADWLVTMKRALLADEMGLGKSAQAILAADRLGLSKILVIGPAVARLTWQNEFAKWSALGRKVKVISKGCERPSPTDEVIIVSFDYASTHRDVLCEFAPDLLVCDETHYLKSLGAKRTQAVLAANGIIHSAKRTWFLTGTPMPNHPGELWPMLKVFGATHLNYDAFVHRFCETYSYRNQTVVSGAKLSRVPELRTLLKSIMLRRRTREVLKDLPRVRIDEILIEGDLDALPKITADQSAILHRMNHLDLLSQIRCLEVLAESVATLRRFCAMQKVKPIATMIKEELENNTYEKIVIFCIHKEVVQSLEEHLKDFGVVKITGEVEANHRQKNIERFQTDPKTRVFIGNIHAAGTNITLTAAHHVMMVESDWVPGNNAQAIARCARIGQTMPVQVRVASIKNSVDEVVNDILFRKSSEIKELLEEN